MKTNNFPTMQEVIRRLDAYWAAHGCTIWTPHSEKVGAGTMNPATVLRVLGPEPWNVAYVEPSFRADDGRYAENPNRMQMHNQYQVILKPDPGNPQELYLGSLAAIGLELVRHDVRFVEDNWESPALGAWGLGWEVWLDGQEITQYTYFQQAGSLPLDPVSVEITYGLDRIVMYLQQKRQVWDIDVDGVHTYEQIYRPAEVEHCVYNYELADVERLKQLFAIYHAEAEACIARQLVMPAHDFVLRQSHTFNLLDARGAIGVTERAKFFADMRRQAHSVAKLYVQQRQNEEFPWLGNGQQGAVSAGQSAAPALQAVDDVQDFVLELGSEELPPQDVVDGIAQVEARLTELLGEFNLDHASLRVSGTPRRLVAYVTGIAPHQRDEVVEKRGPTVDRAFEADGAPTRAALGFAQAQGVRVQSLEVREGYVYAVKRVAGRTTAEVLPDLVLRLLDGLRWRKIMRWNASNVGYPRPLRWIVALYGEQVVPVTWANVSSGRISRGPRFADTRANLVAGEQPVFAIHRSSDFFGALAAQGVVLERSERRQRVAEAVQRLAASVGGHSPADTDLLDEVTDLVEAPTALLGRFEERFLAQPMPVLIAVMKKHQRYFPIVRGALHGEAGEPELLPYFVTVTNSDRLAHPEVVTAGNEGVIRARYSDAAYFVRQDCAHPLDDFTPRLATMTFHTRLGSMLDKVERLRRLAPDLAEALGFGEARDTVGRAAALAKSDLVSSMVVEMTSLQGVMGENYALRSGEPPAVALAIREHYLPRFAGDANPSSPAGLALSLADKLDSLVGLFAVGAAPTGSADPFGLRRAALGAVHNLLASQRDFALRRGLRSAAALQPIDVGDDVLEEVVSFLSRRLQGVLLEMGFAHDVVEAVLAVRGDNPYAALRACRALSASVAQPWWSEVFTAYARCVRITRTLAEPLPLDPDRYVEPSEHALHAGYTQVASVLAAANEPSDLLGEQLRALQPPIDLYFASVLVNAEDAALRSARLALVQRIAALPRFVADLSKLQGF